MTTSALIEVVCTVLNLTPAEATMRTRKRRISRSRFVVWAALRKYTRMSNCQIAELFGFKEDAVKDGVRKVIEDTRLYNAFGYESDLTRMCTMVKEELGHIQRVNERVYA